MYNTILVPLDGSARAEAILPHVEELARRYQATLILLQAIDPTTSIPDLEGLATEINLEIVQEEIKAATDYLTGLQDRLRQKAIESRILVERGAVVDAIIAVAEREKADLIAMASHGRTGLARVLFGSVAQGVLNHAKKPVLFLRAPVEQ
jgi:nucleotide-binding universal stress UspA family protein